MSLCYLFDLQVGKICVKHSRAFLGKWGTAVIFFFPSNPSLWVKARLIKTGLQRQAKRPHLLNLAAIQSAT